MKTSIQLMPLLFVGIAFTACKKETTSKEKEQVTKSITSSANESFIRNAFTEETTPIGKGGKWIGGYQYNAGPNHQYYRDESFIKDGVAFIPRPNDYSWYYTGVFLRIPEEISINADAVRIEAHVINKNEFSNTYYSYGRHSNVVLYGSSDTAWCAMNDPERSDAIIYCQYGFGGIVTPNISGFLFSQQDWYTLGMETINQQLNFYKDGVQTHTAGYNGLADMGSLKGITVYFYGSGKVDWVKLYNSETNALIMEENFNKDGDSKVLWY